MTKDEIKSKYLNNETILWQGGALNVPLLNKSDILLIPFTLIFGGLFIIYALISALMMIAGESALFSLVGITFLLIGLYILFFRIFYRKKRIQREIYFVTENRVFAFDSMRDEVIFDISLNETELYLGDKSLILGSTNSIGDFVYNLGLDIFFRKFIKATPTFKYIDDISGVYKIIIENKKKEVEIEDDSIFI